MTTFVAPTLPQFRIPLHIIWSFRNHKKFILGEWRYCFGDSMRLLTCLNITLTYTSQTEVNYILVGNLEAYINQNVSFNLKKLPMSWNEASKTCRKIGGYLPYFSNKEEMDILIHLLSESYKIPFMEALFIGINFNSSEVNNSFIGMKFYAINSLIICPVLHFMLSIMILVLMLE